MSIIVYFLSISIFNVTMSIQVGHRCTRMLFSDKWPLTYTLYLLQKLKTSNVGCHIGHVFAGSFAYADDIILLAPTASSMERQDMRVILLMLLRAGIYSSAKVMKNHRHVSNCRVILYPLSHVRNILVT
jgi:hypothetical protein